MTTPYRAITISQALEALIEALKDESYRNTWRSNIAMAFKDEWASDPRRDVNIIANKAADRFLELLSLDRP